MTQAAAQTFGFQAEVSQVLKLVINSLYSNRDIFLRELVSNASDAIDKLKFKAIEDKSLIASGDPKIRIIPDDKAHTLTLEDDGVGMTHAELEKNLGTIAHSGTQRFLEELAAQGKRPDATLIGQFGVGFYSAFLVSERVEVISRAAGSEEAWRWSSEAKDTFEIAPGERASHGTTVVLHLKEDAKEYADRWKLKSLVTQYSDFVSHPIELPAYRAPDAEGPIEYERANSASALWTRSKADITAEQYTEFYRHVTHDYDDPIAHTHFTIEGTQLFTGLLYLPKRAPFDLYHREHRRGVRLYVKRIFIMDDCKELVPEWLRFVRGIVDSDDLPLNVSRELLQDSRITRSIRTQVIKKSLDLIEELAKDRPEDYVTFWTTFGPVLKEGLHFDAQYKERIAELLRYASTKGERTSLAEYVARMPEGQPAIYYLTGDSRAALEGSPFMEGLTKRGYEVLFMTDSVDEWAVEALGEYKDKPLVLASRADLKLEQSDEEKKANEEKHAPLNTLLSAMKTVLDEKVSEVTISDRLTDSPVCLVVPEGGLSAHMERLLRSHERDTPKSKRILEVNPDHVLTRRLLALHEKDPTSVKLIEYVEVLYDQALITEGSPVADPQRFARRMTKLLEEATSAAT